MLPVAFLYAIFSFVRLIMALSNQSSWKSKAVLCPAVVAQESSREENYKRKKGTTRIQYTMHINHQGQWVMGLYEEILDPKSATDLYPGKNVSLLYDPITGLCKDPEALKAEVKNQVTMLLVSIAIIVVCLVVVSLMG